MKNFCIFTDHGNMYRVTAPNEGQARIKAMPKLKHYEIIESAFEDDAGEDED